MKLHERLIRRREGHAYIGGGVGCAVFQEGKILMAQRSLVTRNEKGKWEIPGGGIRFGETGAAAAEREIFEELGIRVKVNPDPTSVLFADHIIPSTRRRRIEHWVAPLYEARIVEGTPTIREPRLCTATGWYTLPEAAELDVTVVTQADLDLLTRKYPQGLPQ